MGKCSTILLVEGDPDTAALLQTTLGQGGRRILLARTVAEGGDILAAFRVGLVIAEAQPPVVHPNRPIGIWEDLDPLTQAAGGAALILCSADERARYADHAAHGFAAFLTKPLDIDALLALVGVFLPLGGQATPVATTAGRQPVAQREG